MPHEPLGYQPKNVMSAGILMHYENAKDWSGISPLEKRGRVGVLLVKKCGTVVQLCNVRSAIRRCTEESDGPVGGVVSAVAAFCVAGLNIGCQDFSIGPELTIEARSMPASCAMRRAFGQMRRAED